MCADYEDEMDPSNEQRRISLLPVYDPATCVFFDQDSKNNMTALMLCGLWKCSP